MESTDLPDLDELLWLFEVEPEVMDPDVPLPYNTLTYRTERDRDELVCIISPAYRDLEILWRCGDRELVHLSLTTVTGIRVVKEDGRECLVASVEDDAFPPLWVQLKPTVNVRWRMNLEAGL